MELLCSSDIPPDTGSFRVYFPAFRIARYANTSIDATDVLAVLDTTESWKVIERNFPTFFVALVNLLNP